MMDCILAIDAGGTNFKFAPITSDGALGEVQQIPICSNGTKDNIIDAYRQLITSVKANGYQIKGVGISTPGPFDYKSGKSLMKHKFAALYGIPLKEIISEIAEGVSVWFCQDANAFLAGELYNGAAKDEKNVICVTLGTGLGLAISCENRILTNEQGGPKELLYNRPCEKGGILEDYVSGRGIVAYYQSLCGSKEQLTAKDINMLAETDVYAKRTYDEIGQLLGSALREIVKEYHTECIVIGGQIANAFSLMKDGIVRGLEMPNLQIVRAKNLDSAALYGVVALKENYES